MARKLYTSIAASLSLSVIAAHVDARPVRTLLTSGLGGDATTFGDHLAFRGDTLAVSNWSRGYSTFAFSGSTATRHNAGVSGCAQGVDVSGDQVLVAAQTGSFQAYRLGMGYLQQSLSLGGMGLELAADGRFAVVSYIEWETGEWKVALFEKIGSAWSRSGTFSRSGEPSFGRSIDVVDLPDTALINGGWTKRARLIIGSHEADLGSMSEVGKAYIYELADNSNVGGDEAWRCTAYLYADTPVAGGAYAMDVALSGDYAFVADNDPAGVPGSVDVWAKNSNGTWSRSRTITGPGGSIRNFGWSIAAYGGDHLLVGAPANYSNYNGCAYLYERTSSGDWVYHSTLTTTDPTGDPNLGRSVALGHKRAAVGGADLYGAGVVAAWTFTITEW